MSYWMEYIWWILREAVSLAKGTRQFHQKFIGIIEIFQKYPALFDRYSAISISKKPTCKPASPCKHWHCLFCAAALLEGATLIRPS